MKIIPNLITLAALCMGCLSMAATIDGELDRAAAFILTALVFDFLDGFSARLLQTVSELGKQLDTLADMVSFGAAPAMLMYSYSKRTIAQGPFEDDLFISFLPYLSLLIVLAAALRLGKFNITNQAVTFSGIPSPLSAVMFAAIPLVEEAWQQRELPVSSQIIIDAVAGLSSGILLTLMGLAMIVVSLLMVLDFPILSLKFTSFSWRTNELRYLFLAGLPICFLVFGCLGFIIGSLLYITLTPAIWNRRSEKFASML